MTHQEIHTLAAIILAIVVIADIALLNYRDRALRQQKRRIRVH